MAKKNTSAFWTSVTPFSKVVALLMFIFIPLLTFFLGVHYGEDLARVQYEQLPNTYLIQAPGRPTPTQNMMYKKTTSPMMGY